MILRRRRTIGLDLSETAIRAVEIASKQGAFRVLRAAEFIFPQGMTWQDPAHLGAALREFLRHNGFSTNRAVLGLPACWLMVRATSVPPAEADATAGVARIEAERAFSADPAELALDFADSEEYGRARPLLLAAVMKSRLGQVIAMARAARLLPLSITSSALALAAATDAPSASREATLLAGSAAADIVMRSGRDYRALIHVALRSAPAAGPSGAAAAIAAELRRALAGAAYLPGEEQESLLTIWEGRGLMSGAAAELGAQFGLQVHIKADLAGLGAVFEAGAEDGKTAGFAPAVALAMAGLQVKPLPVDWLHSRLAPPVHKWGRHQTWAAAIGAAALAAVVALFALWWLSRSEVNALKRRLDALHGDYVAAQATLDKLATARDWYEGRPRALDALRALSAALPPEGRAYVTNITIRPVAGTKGLKGSFIARSTEQDAALQVLDRLKASPSFSDVQSVYTGAAGRNSREITFTISFTYLPAGANK